MMEIASKSPTSFGQRCRTLNVAAHALRQRATRSGGDLEAWRLSRLMREADTDAEVDIAEHKYSVWLRSIALQEMPILS
jgi:hypothetical protein